MYPYSGLKLLELLEKQQQKRTANLFRSGVFILPWRTKVGSFPHPDLETIVGAGEPCGTWKLKLGCPQGKNRPEDKRNLGDNLEYFSELPIHGYIPAASIRGMVRAWLNQHPHLRPRMQELLGWQNGNEITTGKFEFLDAFPLEPTKLTLDIVNPQQEFQVFHQGQGKPLSLYTLGNGNKSIAVKIAVRGITGKATEDEVAEVWEWLQQALSVYGLGSRTAAGYGTVIAPVDFQATAGLPELPEGYSSKVLSFNLYSQGNAGPDMRVPELRPNHWRGWLRSWLLRFFLGVMSEQDAVHTVGELLGTLQESIDGQGRKGSVRIKLTPGKEWGKKSESTRFQRFYKWQGSITITAPNDILTRIIIPILKFAVMVGGVGRGWRRPLHLFVMNSNDQLAARGCHLTFHHKAKSPRTNQWETQPFGIQSNPETWQQLYDRWAIAAQQQWPERFQLHLPAPNAEAFSPMTCAVYEVDGPVIEPINTQDLQWSTQAPLETRGDGMRLIYQPTYKRKPEVGGNAGQGEAHCSWVSVKRSWQRVDGQIVQTEIVCIFMGQAHNLRQSFLKDLQQQTDSILLFGL
jgi:CRISPR-associated protein Cmr6